MTDLAPSPLSVKLLPLPVVQLTPALVLYCHVAPASRPATLTVPALVMLSAAIPLSLAKVMVGAEGGVVSGGGGTTVSSVNAKAPELVLRLPATSVWRTVTDLAPSPVSVKLLPVPVVQLVPPLVLYCQVAPASSPATFTVPLLVIPSPTTPLSTAKLAVGAVAAVSRLKASALELALRLPAASVWRTMTDLAPSPVRAKVEPVPAVQLVPPSVLYCQVAPASRPATLTVPALVMLSVVMPLLAARVAVGAVTVVSSVKLSAAELAPTLPVASVWRTMTDLAPSPVSVKLVPLPLDQLVPPLVLYCQVAPASSPATLTVPTLVMLSLPRPLSVPSVTVGAAAALSIVKASALELALTLPATSVWRTMTDLAPSPASVKLVPLPAVQLLPPLVLYCQVAPASRPVTLTVALLVMPSPATPLSTASAATGDAAAVSSVKASAVELVLTLPAASVWRTMTDLAPSPLKVKLLALPVVQLVPALVLYCQVAPASRPETLTMPTFVMLSVERPLFVASEAIGADGGVVSGTGVGGRTTVLIVNIKALELALTLPATSVWRTVTDFAPSPVSVKLLPAPVVQLVPPLVLYCQVAPASSPVTFTVPLLVIPSPTTPLSTARLAVGAAAAVSRVKARAPELALTLPAASV